MLKPPQAKLQALHQKRLDCKVEELRHIVVALFVFMIKHNEKERTVYKFLRILFLKKRQQGHRITKSLLTKKELITNPSRKDGKCRKS